VAKPGLDRYVENHGEEIAMTRLLLILLASTAALSACIVVPVGPRGAYYDPAPAYVAPGPVVRPYYGHRYLRHRHYYRHWD
jgi:hypothetical protein